MFIRRYIARITIVTISYLFSTNAAVSQEFNYGFFLGGNLGSPISTTIPEGASGKPIPGLNLGAFAGYEFSENFRIEIAVNYANFSSQFNTPLDSMPYIDKIPHPIYPDIVFEIETFFNGTAIGTFSNTYIQKSLSQYFKLSDNLEILIGTYTAMLLRSNSFANATGTVGFDPKTIEEKMDFSQYTRKLDAGINIGISYWFGKHMNIEPKITCGFQSIYNESFTALPYDLNNLFLQINFHYHFRKKIM